MWAVHSSLFSFERAPGKHGTAPFFDALEAELRRGYGLADVVRVVKPNYSAPAGDEILDHARGWHALVAGIGD